MGTGNWKILENRIKYGAMKIFTKMESTKIVVKFTKFKNKKTIVHNTKQLLPYRHDGGGVAAPWQFGDYLLSLSLYYASEPLSVISGIPRTMYATFPERVKLMQKAYILAWGKAVNHWKQQKDGLRGCIFRPSGAYPDPSLSVVCIAEDEKYRRWLT